MNLGATTPCDFLPALLRVTGLGLELALYATGRRFRCRPWDDE